MPKNKAQKKAIEPARIQNRKARFDYQILESLEAGIALVGSEVKSILYGKASIADAYCRIQNGEVFLINADVEPYEKGSFSLPERRRDRKLLMHRREINTLDRKSMEKGLTMIPLAMYFKNGKVKVEIGLAKGKSNYDKRTQLAKDDTRKEADRIRKGDFS